MLDSKASANLLLARLLTAPGLDDLRGLQGLLLIASADDRRRADAERALQLAGELHDFLSELESKLGAKAYSQFASLLDIGAVGAVALETLSDPARRRPLSVGLAALGEGLMVLASRQYVKAWQRELGPLADRAVWRCREALWRLSAGRCPDPGPAGRMAAIDSLLAPAADPDIDAEARHAFVARLLQLLVVATAVCALDARIAPAGDLASAVPSEGHASGARSPDGTEGG